MTRDGCSQQRARNSSAGGRRIAGIGAAWKRKWRVDFGAGSPDTACILFRQHISKAFLIAVAATVLGIGAHAQTPASPPIQADALASQLELIKEGIVMPYAQHVLHLRRIA